MTITTADTYARLWNKLFDENKIIMANSCGFQRFFNNPFANSRTLFSFDDETFEDEVIRGSKTIAPMVPRGTVGAKIIEEEEERTGEWSSFARTYPLARKISSITTAQVTKRVPGEPPYGTWTRRERRAWLAMQIHIKHVRQMVGLFEYLAAQMVLTGKMPAILGTSNADLIYDYRRNTNNIISVPVYWDTGSPDILGDFDDGLDQMQFNGKVPGDIGVIGEDAMEAFLKDDTIKTWFDTRRLDLGTNINVDDLPESVRHFAGDGGFNFRMKLETPKGRTLYLFTYLDHYEYPKATFLKYMPKDKGLLAYSKAMCSRHFGPDETLEKTTPDRQWMEEIFGFSEVQLTEEMNLATGNVVMPEMFHVNAYPSDNRKQARIATETAPVFGTNHTDAFVLLEDLIDPGP